MKLYIFIISFLALSISAISQTTVSQHRIHIPYIVGSGYGYEVSIADEFTINMQVDLKLAMGTSDIDNDGLGAVDELLMQPRIYLEPRYYYNLKKRALNGKNIENNASNYLSLNISYDFPYALTPYDYRSQSKPLEAYRIEPTWGLRRPISDKGTIDFAIFAGTKYTPIYNHHEPYTNSEWVISLGFRLNIGFSL